MLKRLLKQLPYLTLCICTFIFFSPASAVENKQRVIRLATTTSTENSGLLDNILPQFEQTSGYRVHVIAVGTGKALRMGSDGDVDVVLVHARAAEEEFVNSGYGVNRQGVMYNDFVLVGPSTDPAAIDVAEDASQALARIGQKKALFISRGDDSGTHKKELSLWNAANLNPGVNPGNNWYREAGQGMGKVLQMTAELDAYTLTDRGTWLSYREKSPLKILYEGDSRLYNPYGIIAVNNQRYPDINRQGADALIAWFISATGQELINNYQFGGMRLFTASANKGMIKTALPAKSDGWAE